MNNADLFLIKRGYNPDTISKEELFDIVNQLVSKKEEKDEAVLDQLDSCINTISEQINIVADVMDELSTVDSKNHEEVVDRSIESLRFIVVDGKNFIDNLDS